MANRILTKKEFIPLILIIACFIIGFYFYPQLPDKIPSHWNAQGEIDAWNSKDFAVWFFPSLGLIVYVLMTFIPFIDPLRRNYAKFALPYFWIRLLLIVFFLSLYLYVLLGANININYFIIPAISLLFIVMGLFLPKIKKNYFVGVRTPWTIHSEQVWDKTHVLAGKLYVLAGIATFLGLIFVDYAIFILLVSIIGASLISVAYSYFIFRDIGGFNK